MFEQLPAWGSKISLRVAMLNAIGFGFTTGMCSTPILTSVLRGPRLDAYEWVMLPLFTAFSAGMAMRFYFLVMSRSREKLPPQHV
jgi:cytochrome c biogenesis protein CcdA